MTTVSNKTRVAKVEQKTKTQKTKQKTIEEEATKVAQDENYKLLLSV